MTLGLIIPRGVRSISLSADPFISKNGETSLSFPLITYQSLPRLLIFLSLSFPKMSAPDWVKALKPAGQPGSELLAEERSQSNVDVDKLAELLHTRVALERQDRLLALMKNDKVFDKSQNHTLGRTERIQRALAKGKRLQQLSVQHNWNYDDFYAANELLGEPTPYGLHASMFLVSRE